MVEFFKPRASYIICTSPRSGSWLLAEGLQATTLAGYPREWFHKDVEARRCRQWGLPNLEEGGFAEYIHRVLSAATTPNGVFGLKLHWYQLQRLMDKLAAIDGFRDAPPAEALPRLLPNLKLIWLTRRNKIRQSISLHRARQTGTWWHPESYSQKRPVLGQASFDPVAIDAAERYLLANEAGWQSLFRDSQAKPLLVVYEDLVAEYEQTIRRALRYLELPNADHVPIAPPRTKLQSDSTTDDWLNSYLAFKNGGAIETAIGPPIRVDAGSRPLTNNPAQAAASAAPPREAQSPGSAAGPAPPVETSRGVDGPRQPPPAPPGRHPSQAQGVLAVYRSLARLDPSRGQVERHSAMPAADFLRNYYAANRPVVLTGLMTTWPAMSKWSPDYLKHTLAGESIRLDSGNASQTSGVGSPSAREIPFEQLADSITRRDAARSRCFLAPPAFLRRPQARRLFDDIAPPADYLDPRAAIDQTCVALEPAGFVAPLRHEFVNVMLAQVYGRKTIKLIPAYDIDLLYAGAGRISPVNPYEPDLTKHPKYEQAGTIDVELAPGEMLFLPVGWWHAERTVDVNISLIFTNFAFPNRFARPQSRE